jgi:hypothetical protein
VNRYPHLESQYLDKTGSEMTSEFDRDIGTQLWQEQLGRTYT